MWGLLTSASCMRRCNEEAVEEDVKKRSQTEEAMGAKSLCHPFAKELAKLPLGGGDYSETRDGILKPAEGTQCFASGKPATHWTLWGRSY